MALSCQKQQATLLKTPKELDYCQMNIQGWYTPCPFLISFPIQETHAGMRYVLLTQSMKEPSFQMLNSFKIYNLTATLWACLVLSYNQVCLFLTSRCINFIPEQNGCLKLFPTFIANGPDTWEFQEPKGLLLDATLISVCSQFTRLFHSRLDLMALHGVPCSLDYFTA